MPIEERIERARLEREAQERREARRTHPGVDDAGQEPLPSFARPGIRTGVAHLYEGVSGMSKRVAFLLGIFGACSTVASSAFAWWTSHQGFVTENRMATWEANLRGIELAAKSTETMVGTLSPRVEKLETTSVKHSEELASMRPRITATEKPHR